MAHQIVYGICEDKCKEEVYSKEEIPFLTKTVTGVELADIEGILIPYPEGYTKYNTLILVARATYLPMNTTVTPSLLTNGIKIPCSSGFAADENANYTAVCMIMKYEL
jgi:hypothetical protein